MNDVVSEPLCPYCQSPLAADGGVVSCPGCGAHHHEECWRENGGCSVYGCRQTLATESRTEMEIPASWWGQENKPCPSCGREILAAALRCRHCGATFASARPEDQAEFRQRVQVTSEHPGLRARTVWMFVLSVLPLSAPVGAIMGAVWY
jgi:predicted amidophosphoribosyltransferase